MHRNNIEPEVRKNGIFLLSLCQGLKKIIAVRLAGQPEGQSGLSDLGSDLARSTTWVGRILLSPVA